MFAWIQRRRAAALIHKAGYWAGRAEALEAIVSGQPNGKVPARLEMDYVHAKGKAEGLRMQLEFLRGGPKP